MAVKVTVALWACRLVAWMFEIVAEVQSHHGRRGHYHVDPALAVVSIDVGHRHCIALGHQQRARSVRRAEWNGADELG